MKPVVLEKPLPKVRERTRRPAKSIGREFSRLGPVEYRPIDSLVTYKNNPRKHPESQLASLAEWISRVGFIVPVLATRAGEIIAGEGRVAAARRAGMLEIPTIFIEHLSDVEVKAFRLLDNQLAAKSEWDYGLLRIEIDDILVSDIPEVIKIGWETGEVDAFRIFDADVDSTDPADDVPEPLKAPVTRSGDIWMCGPHRVRCGSSLETQGWSLLMNGREARMCITDPPFNVPISGHVCGSGKIQHAEFKMASGEMSEAEFIAFLLSSLKAMSAQLVDGAILQVFMDWRHLYELLIAARTADLSVVNLCVWNKTNAGMGSLYRSKHELVLILKKGNGRHVNTVELGK